MVVCKLCVQAVCGRVQAMCAGCVWIFVILYIFYFLNCCVKFSWMFNKHNYSHKTGISFVCEQVAAIVFFLITSFPGNGVHETIPNGKQPQDVPQLSDLTWELPLALALISLGGYNR